MKSISSLQNVLETLDSPTTSKPNLRLAAVLIPLFPDSQKILFTKRNENLKQHQGQIAFPGGRFEVSDSSLVETALRETKEEVGIDRKYIEVIGRLNPLVTTSQHYVYPYVGLVEDKAEITINPDEVQEYFFADITHLLNQENCEKELFKGILLPYYQVDNYKIWGVTQQILTEFLNRVRLVN